MEFADLIGVGRVEDKGTINRRHAIIASANYIRVTLQHCSQRLRPREVEVVGELARLLDIGDLQAIVVGILVAHGFVCAARSVRISIRMVIGE